MNKAKTQLNEERTAAASYIITFYNTVQTLTGTYANYSNVLDEIEAKHGAEVKGMDAQEKEALRTLAIESKYWVKVAYIQWSSIRAAMPKDKTTEKTEKEFDELFDKIDEQFIPDKKTLRQFTTAANARLIGGIVQNLLQTSNEVLAQIYGNSSEEDAS